MAASVHAVCRGSGHRRQRVSRTAVPIGVPVPPQRVAFRNAARADGYGTRWSGFASVANQSGRIVTPGARPAAAGTSLSSDQRLRSR
jgi:hypothetical protein